MKIKLVKLASLPRWEVSCNEVDSDSTIKEFWFKRNAIKFAKKVSLFKFPDKDRWEFFAALRNKHYFYENGEETK